MGREVLFPFLLSSRLHPSGVSRPAKAGLRFPSFLSLTDRAIIGPAFFLVNLVLFDYHRSITMDAVRSENRYS
jgi:hypothetical protein